MTRRILLCLAAGAALLAGCDSGEDEPSTAASTTTTARPQCEPVKAHPIDPGSGQHILPGAPEPTSFNTDPPTSGPHAPGAHPTGVVTTPLSRAVQVAMLEGGEVLIQYGDVPAGTRAALEALATPGSRVTVAPNPSLPAPIVATAWLHSQRCAALDTTALESFVSSHSGKHEGH